jgi:hypothetical protein
MAVFQGLEFNRFRPSAGGFSFRMVALHERDARASVDVSTSRLRRVDKPAQMGIGHLLFRGLALVGHVWICRK